MNNVLGSRYVKRLLKSAEYLKKKLDLLQETLEEWIVCQRNWIYLENIFSSSDIKKRLTNEFADFDKIDFSFKKLMGKVYKHRKVLQFTQTSATLEELTRNNAVMEKIQKQLDEYLESKRIEFPRFYFLSSDELLEILANALNVGKIEKHLNKMFDNVHSLYTEKTVMGTSDIKGLRSLEGEVLSFDKRAIKPRQVVEVWLKQLEQEMQGRLQLNMKKGYNDWLEKGEKGRPDWVLSHLA